MSRASQTVGNKGVMIKVQAASSDALVRRSLAAFPAGSAPHLAAEEFFLRRLTLVKKAMILLLLLVGVQMAAQDKSTITVKGSNIVSDVVIVNAVNPNIADKSKASFELRCNKGPSSCKAPEPGPYLMVRLPKNWGMYDCANVDLYPATANPDTDQKIGEYCLIEK